jgi:methylated-DNA-[protein]-cysteine S-methyltransferase
MAVIVPIALPEGVFLAHYSPCGLCGLDWPRAKKPRLADQGPKPALPRLRLWHHQTRQALRRVLAGEPAGRLPPLDVSAGTPFQRRVWRQLRRIPTGQTRTYAWIAAVLRQPRAARAVGNACGANPIPLLVPCHRVVPCAGGLGGFSGPLAWKKRLLELENAR